MTSLHAILGGLGAQDVAILLILGVLLFGRKLPDFVRFWRKGLKGELDSEEQSSFFLGLLLLAGVLLIVAFCFTAIGPRGLKGQ